MTSRGSIPFPRDLLIFLPCESLTSPWKNTVLKGLSPICSYPEKIILIQDGNSGYTIHGYPLFIAGNELLVFLKNADDEAYENAFWIEGSYTTFFDVVRSGKDLYYLDRYGMIGDGVSACDNLFFDAELSAKLYAALEKQDPLAKDRRYHFIYSAEQMDAYLERLKTGE